jgi:hypothetical protein
MRKRENPKLEQEATILFDKYYEEYGECIPDMQAQLDYYIKHGSKELVDDFVRTIKVKNQLGYNLDVTYNGKKL